MVWGYHLVLNAAKCSPVAIRNRHTIDKFARTLVKRIDMVPYGKPQIVMFGEGNKKGYTLIQLIQTSNICAHFVEETNDLYLDVFSCKDFKSTEVEKHVHQFFNPTFVETELLVREAPNWDTRDPYADKSKGLLA